jgi:hypothetical protein
VAPCHPVAGLADLGPHGEVGIVGVLGDEAPDADLA